MVIWQIQWLPNDIGNYNDVNDNYSSNLKKN